MANAAAVLDLDRLPWLADEHRAPAPRGPSPLSSWSLAAAAILAAGSYWYGMQDRSPPAAVEPAMETGAPSVTAELPPPAEAIKTAPLWSSWESDGAAGRMIRIGDYPTRLEAKRGWVRLASDYPPIAPFQAVVVPAGDTAYRLQIGTRSQAHSEALCRAVRATGRSCDVIGLGQWTGR